MTINLNDDYDKLAKILYPSIEASGNVYYGQTRKLTMDEVFDKYNGGFDSHIESRRVDDSSADYGFRYEKYFCWKLGPLYGEFCIDGDGEHHIPLESYPLYYAKYLLNKSIVTEENILNSGVYNSYHYDVNAVLKKVFYHGGKNPDSEDQWDGKSFYVINDGTNDYLYIAVTNGAYDEAELLPEEYDQDNPLCIKLVYEKSDDHELPLSDCKINVRLVSHGSVSNKNIYQYSFDKQQWSDFDIDDSPVMMEAFESDDGSGGPKSKLYIKLKDSATKDVYTLNNYVNFNVEQVDGIGHIDVLGDIRSMQQSKTMLQPYEFCNLFSGCEMAQTLPDLPCKLLAEGCYASMFQQCSNVKYPPRLYATNLSSKCYYNMFYLCTNMTKAPVLLPSEVPSFAYSYMIKQCSIKRSCYIFASVIDSSSLTEILSYNGSHINVYCATGDVTSGVDSFKLWLDGIEHPIIHTSKHAEWSTSNTQVIPSGAEFKYDFELEYTYDD